MRAARTLLLSFLCLSIVDSLVAQETVGLIHLSTGRVAVDELPFQGIGVLSLEPGEEMVCTQGMTEMLLLPGLYVRLSEGSAVKMHKAEPSDVVLELMKGNAIFEAVRNPDERATLQYGDIRIKPQKKGVLRLDAADPTSARAVVLKGAALAVVDGESIPIKSKQALSLSGDHAVAKAGKPPKDALAKWHKDRSNQTYNERMPEKGFADLVGQPAK